jgi:MYXO-CTERM domain-containing protein
MRSWVAILGLVVGMKLLSIFAVAGNAGAETPPPAIDARPADVPLPLADANPTDVPVPIDAPPPPDVPVVPDAPRFDSEPATSATDSSGCGVAGGSAEALVLVLAALAAARRRRA